MDLDIFKFFTGVRAKAKPKTRRRIRVSDDDVRLAIRKKQRLVEGYVWAPNMLVARHCSIKDLSAVGALVEIWKGRDQHTIREVRMPDRVVLYIIPDQIEVDCEITWRKDRALGLRFLGKFRPGSRQYGAA